MTAIAFQGAGLAFSSQGIAATASAVGVQGAEIWALIDVETSGCGFLPDRRPQMRFERHIFHRLTSGEYDDGDISDPTPGGYGAPGAHQYDRLAVAISKDREAALQSASWGIGQVMGMSYAAAGFQNVEDMVAAMSASEDQQLAAVARFLVASNLCGSLQAHNWQSFALRYNGTNYRANQYDSKLAAAFQAHSAGSVPDLNVRAVQLYLTYLGYQPGPVDGVAGPRTLSALAAFQASRGLPSSTTIDAACVAQLTAALTAARAV